MNAPLFVNAFHSRKDIDQNFRVWALPVATSNLKALYEKFRMLSLSGIADSTSYGGTVYFKGDPDRVIENLSKLPNTYLGSDLKEISVSPTTGGNLIVNLMYSAFERILQSKNWRVLSKKRAIPALDKEFEDFHLQLSDSAFALYGLKYMFEIRPSGSVLLWLDTYAPVWSTTNERRLAKNEIGHELRKLYANKAMLRPDERFKKLQEILDTLFFEEILVEFCDRTSISFLKENYKISHLQEEYMPPEPLQWALIEEPMIRFKYGYSKNPRKILSLKAYSYSTIREVRIKAIVEKSLKEGFFRLYENLVKGFSGSFISWPGFFHVTGADIHFDERSDFKEIENNDENEILGGLINVFRDSEEKKNSVAFIVLNEISPRAYNFIKAEAIRRGVCTQVILKDTLTKEPFEFTLTNIAAAVYAKAGGLPWVLKDPLTVKLGLFVGISFHVDHRQRNIYYGVIEVFDRYGAHLKCFARMYRCTNEIKSVRGLFIPKEEAEKIIGTLISDYNPREIIFHKSAPFHNDEKEAIEEICRQHDIDYCLIHVEGANPYRVYAPQQGFTPLRGTIVLDLAKSNRAILVTTGQSVVDYGRKLPGGIGTPKPLEIVIEKEKGNHTVREICEQLLALTKLDWNTTNVSVRSPITLKYSRKAARLAKYFEGIGEGLVAHPELKYLI